MKILSDDALSQVTGGASAFGGWSSWMVENRNEFTSAQAKRNYEKYRERRDRSGDQAAKARSRSRSDMNSPGDQRSGDRISGR